MKSNRQARHILGLD
ncbi:hypothetical protein JZM28_25395, partial [Enterobacter hormaechei]|nr:hypothetical protein [Enterobacter hormaechei]HBV0101216.1 hypothetical protein [Escherichia coli]